MTTYTDWHLPAHINGTTQTGGYTLHVRAVFDDTEGRYLVRSITVTAADVPEVTGEGLRTIPVASVLRDIVKAAVTDTSLARRQPPHDLVTRHDISEILEWVAFIYRRAVAFGDPPTEAVAELLRVPRSTARMWATRARDRGLLTVLDKRGRRKD